MKLRITVIPLGAVLGGLGLALLGQALFASMCDCNAYLYGALLGALGGVIIGVLRQATTVRWFGVGGGVLFALVATVMSHFGHGDDVELFAALGSGSLTGFGFGMIADGVRRLARPAAADATGPADPSAGTGSGLGGA